MKKEIKSIEIKTVNDIRKALIPFINNSKKDDIIISGEFAWNDEENNQKMKTKFSVDNKNIGLKDLLIEGFDQVKQQENTWNMLHDALDDDEFSVTLPRIDIDNFHMPVDRLIKSRLGGKRKGHSVVWNINNHVYEFNPYTCEFKE
jgi:hypothetical protein